MMHGRYFQLSAIVLQGRLYHSNRILFVLPYTWSQTLTLTGLSCANRERLNVAHATEGATLTEVLLYACLVVFILALTASLPHCLTRRRFNYYTRVQQYLYWHSLPHCLTASQEGARKNYYKGTVICIVILNKTKQNFMKKKAECFERYLAIFFRALVIF